MKVCVPRNKFATKCLCPRISTKHALHNSLNSLAHYIMTPICIAPKMFASSWRNRVKTLLSIRTLHTANLIKQGGGSFAVELSKIRALSTSPQFADESLAVSDSFERFKVSVQPVKSAPIPSAKDILLRSKKWFTVDDISTVPGLQADGAVHSLPQLKLDMCSRQGLMDYFLNTWTMTEALLSCLKGPEAFVKSPYHELRHPMIFYYGHCAALYVNKLRVANLIDKGVNPYFESLFETGVDEMSWDDLSKNKMAWPSVEEVREYRKEVLRVVLDVINSASDDAVRSIDQNSPYWALVLSMEHERIHLETSSVLINELPAEYVQRPLYFPGYHNSIPKVAAKTPVPGKDYPRNAMVPVAAQEVLLGKDRDTPSYGWDNEYGRKVVHVPAFKASAFQVSNGEFLEFVNDGGYSDVSMWTEAGWGWRAFRNAKHPLFWVRSGPQGLHQYKLRAIFEEVEMPWAWPVAVNFHEAAAFCAWKSRKTGSKIRCLTEPEFHAINDTKGVQDPVLDAPGGDMFRAYSINANLRYSSPCPVNQDAPNAKGFHGVMGNAWEWCMDYFSALPGFTVHSYYEDFSTPCFDGLHNVIKGGSFMSTGNEASVHSRFHFRPHFHQHASFRLVEQLGDALVTSDTDAPGPYVGNYPFRRSTAGIAKEMHSRNHVSLASALSKHFGAISEQFGVRSAPSMKDVVVEGMRGLRIGSDAKILEVNCGLGSLALALAPHASRVIGVDHSADNIATAKRLAAGETVRCELPGEGDSVVTTDISSMHRVSGAVAGSLLDFRNCDSMCVPAEFVDFDVVVLSDVLDKVAAPNSVLGRLGGPRGLVRQGGLLVVSSAYAWSENITPRSLWIDGDSLAERLSQDFELVDRSDLPVYWQEKTRELRATLLDVHVFRRK